MLQVEAYSSIGGRSKNEDCVTGTHMGKRMCFLVADGLGGHGDGDIASRAAIDTVCGAWNGTISAAEWQRLLELAHAQIQRLQTPQKQMKTTLVGLMLDTEHAVWAHIGDSRLYHFLDGRLVFQTQDHSASQIAVLLGEIAPSQIRSSKDRAILTKALGQPGDVRLHRSMHSCWSRAYTRSCCVRMASGNTCWRKKWSRISGLRAAQSNGWRKCAGGCRREPRPIRIIILQL